MKPESENSELVLTRGGELAEATAAEAGERATQFQAVEGGPETTSGELLLVEAYAAVWLVVFAFVFVSWRRQARIDARMGELEKRLAEHQG